MWRPVAASQQYGVDSQTDVFAVEDGRPVVAWVNGGGAWNGPIGLGPAGVLSKDAALAASPQYGVDGQTDVFSVGNNGQLQVYWANGGGAWNGPVGLGPEGVLPAGAALAASPQYGVDGQTDVFSVGNNGQLQVYWVNGGGTWNGPVGLGPEGVMPPGAALAASPQYGVDGQTDVFSVGNNGQLQVYWVNGGGAWNGPVGLGPEGVFPPGAPLTATMQYGIGDQTDVLGVGNNGQLQVYWVNGGGAWNGPVGLGPEGLFPAGAGVAASPQYGVDGQTDVFAVAGDGQVRVFWAVGGGAWNGPIAAATPVVTASGDQIDFDFPSITFDNGVPVGGFAHVTMFKSGNCRFTGHFHDSGATEYNMAAVVTVKDSGGMLYTLGHQGHVSGTFQSGPRDDDWDASVQDDRVAARWPLIAAGSNAQVHSSADGDLVNLTNLAIGAAGLVLSVIGLIGSGSSSHPQPA